MISIPLIALIVIILAFFITLYSGILLSCYWYLFGVKLCLSGGILTRTFLEAFPFAQILSYLSHLLLKVINDIWVQGIIVSMVLSSVK